MLTLTPEQTKMSPTQRIKKLVIDKQWNDCKQEVKRIYQIIKPKISTEQQSNILVWIYNQVNDTQVCEYSITEYWHYMNN